MAAEFSDTCMIALQNKDGKRKLTGGMIFEVIVLFVHLETTRLRLFVWSEFFSASLDMIVLECWLIGIEFGV